MSALPADNSFSAVAAARTALSADKPLEALSLIADHLGIREGQTIPEVAGWDQGAWEVLNGIAVYLGKLKEAQASHSTMWARAARAVRCMQAMATQFPDQVLETDNLDRLLTMVRTPSLAEDVRHGVCWKVVGLAFGYKTNVDETPAVAGVPLLAATGAGAHRIAPGFLITPAYTSKYMYNILAAFDANDAVICNSACQFKSAKGILQHWIPGLKREQGYQHDYGVPALFHTLGALHAEAATPRQKTNSAAAIIEGARYLRTQKLEYAFERAAPHIPAALMPQVKKWFWKPQGQR